MKTNYLFLALFATCMFCSCARPLTDALITKWDAGDRLDKYQYYVSKTIHLDKKEIDKETDIDKGKAKMKTNISNERVTIGRSTAGLVLKYVEGKFDGTYVVWVAFEDDDNRLLCFKRRYYNSGNDKYYIVTNKDGRVQYGNDIYKYSSPVEREWFGLGKVKAEQTPYLKIKATESTHETWTSRKAKGRKL